MIDSHSLYHLKIGSPLVLFLVTDKAVNQFTLQSLMYALAIGQVPSFVKAPVEFLRINNCQVAQKLHYCLDQGEHMNYLARHLLSRVEQEVSSFCSLPIKLSFSTPPSSILPGEPEETQHIDKLYEIDNSRIVQVGDSLITEERLAYLHTSKFIDKLN